MPDRDDMRLDDLAREAGIATTTVRLYQARGLLPPPRLVGRTGYYDSKHLARLALIGRLQHEGFSLAGIGRLLETWESGRDITDLVGVEQQLDSLLRNRRETVVDAAELARRLPTEALTPALMARAVAIGLVEPTDDGRFRIPDDRFLDVGGSLVALGVPASTVLDEWANLSKVTDGIAKRFVRVFEQHVLPDGWSDDLDADRAAELATALAQLRAAASQIVLAALDASVAKEGSRRLAQLAGSETRAGARGAPRTRG